VQLHGGETPAIVDQLSCRALKAIAPDAGDTWRRWPARVTLLVDAHDPARRGGTGRTADWTFAATIARQRPVVLAGGLTAGNVADAVRAVAPVAVDVSSGVETAPGIKDAARMRAFFEAVGRAEERS
jgi:phosphoribosylanthranilate isomerase